MANAGMRRKHVAFMDSRGYELADKVKKINTGEPFVVKVHAGATLEELVNDVDNFLKDFPFHVTYVAGGACDITTKVKGDPTISFDWLPAGKLGPHLVSKLKEADGRLHKDHPAARVIFCPLVGVDLKRVVNAHAVTDHQQEAVNDAVFEFNMEVFSINKDRGSYSPSLHRTVHRSNKGIRRSHYHHLIDGIHLEDYIIDNWAEEFCKAIGQN